MENKAKPTLVCFITHSSEFRLVSQRCALLGEGSGKHQLEKGTRELVGDDRCVCLGRVGT